MRSGDYIHIQILYHVLVLIAAKCLSSCGLKALEGRRRVYNEVGPFLIPRRQDKIRHRTRRR